jgi:hypothetical protein
MDELLEYYDHEDIVAYLLMTVWHYTPEVMNDRSWTKYNSNE